MPEMTVTVRWPDGARQEYYSPSLVMHDHLAAGERYPVADFVARSRAGLDEASERVRARYGFACTSAMATLADIEQRARIFTHPEPSASGGSPAPAGVVEILAMFPGLPTQAHR